MKLQLSVLHPPFLWFAPIHWHLCLFIKKWINCTLGAPLMFHHLLWKLFHSYFPFVIFVAFKALFNISVDKCYLNNIKRHVFQIWNICFMTNWYIHMVYLDISHLQMFFQNYMSNLSFISDQKIWISHHFFFNPLCHSVPPSLPLSFSRFSLLLLPRTLHERKRTQRQTISMSVPVQGLQTFGRERREEFGPLVRVFHVTFLPWGTDLSILVSKITVKKWNGI